MKRTFLIVICLNALLISCSDNERLIQYNQLVNNADSIVFSFNKGSNQTIYSVKDSAELIDLKAILTRNIKPETQVKFISDAAIELFNNGQPVGILLINSNTNYLNFNAESFGFGCQLTYGIGRYLEEIPYQNPLVGQVKGNPSVNHFDCYDGSQLAMNICSMNEYQYYDSILNETYMKLMTILKEHLQEASKFNDQSELIELQDYQKSIIESQKNWIIQRDLNAAIQADNYQGGSMAPMVTNQQRTKDTRHRIEFLTNLLTINRD
ncbi:MAG: lysozyme inhibitor LprI family protein [Bacteroidota bacterium]